MKKTSFRGLPWCLGLIFAMGTAFFPETSGAGTWSRVYGGEAEDVSRALCQTDDGGYVFAGDVLVAPGNRDYWIVKVDASGEVEWEKSYGGSEQDLPHSICACAGGGCAVVGRTESFGETEDIWLIRLDDGGNVLWQRTYDAGHDETGWAVRQTADGGFIVAGSTDYPREGGGIFEASWILRLSGTGGVVWEKTYEGIDPKTRPADVLEDADGGFFFAGYAYPSPDVYAVRLDSTGTMLWQRRFDLGGEDWAASACEARDGGYVIAGTTNKWDERMYDAFALKLDSTGSLVWRRIYYSDNSDWGASIQRSGDGGYYLAGTTGALDWSGDAWLARLDSAGDIVWERAYGGEENEGANSLQKTRDGGYIVGGQTYSFGAGRKDVWILKFDAAGSISDCLSGLVKTPETSTGMLSAALLALDPASGEETEPTSRTTRADVASTELSSSEICTFTPFSLPVPASSSTYAYPAIEVPEQSSAPGLCRPAALGNPLAGTFSLLIGLPPFAGNMDVYLILYFPALDSENLYFITPTTWKPLSAGFDPWMADSTGNIHAAIWEGFPVAGLPSGNYYFAVVAAPAGSNPVAASYFWVTQFRAP